MDHSLGSRIGRGRGGGHERYLLAARPQGGPERTHVDRSDRARDGRAASPGTWGGSPALELERRRTARGRKGDKKGRM